nr:hypothetical protein [Tanacetum cinerariifolium]
TEKSQRRRKSHSLAEKSLRQQNNRKSLPTGAAPLPKSLAADATIRRKEVAKVLPEFYYKFDFHMLRSPGQKMLLSNLLFYEIYMDRAVGVGWGVWDGGRGGWLEGARPPPTSQISVPTFLVRWFGLVVDV